MHTVRFRRQAVIAAVWAMRGRTLSVPDMPSVSHGEFNTFTAETILVPSPANPRNRGR